MTGRKDAQVLYGDLHSEVYSAQYPYPSVF